ncbi:MAG: hypothetical protein R3D01_05360 [Hyphomicrobiales bacterium]
MQVTIDGDVTANSGTAIFARNDYDISTYLSITTNAGSTVTGDQGIYARHEGSGALTITANGSVAATGTDNDGIYARTSIDAMENLTITTGPSAGGVTGDRSGIYAQQFGYAALDITANGNLAVTTASLRGAIQTVPAMVTTGVGATVTADDTGIYARNSARGP